MKKSSKPVDGQNRKRRLNNEEFNTEALRLLRERETDEVTGAELARELGLNPRGCGSGRRVGANGASADGRGRNTSDTLEQAVRRLHREKRDPDPGARTSKKTAAFFARESR